MNLKHTSNRRCLMYLLASLVALLPFGCAANMKDRYIGKDRPIPNVTFTTENVLEKLPKPPEKVLISVWKIPDETGQFVRSTQGGTELSHAVTQGAHHMLIKALNDSGWFNVAERQAWPDLIQEIRIKEELRKRGETRVPEDFKHLAVPQYMISGAITEFEDHPVSIGGGFGLRGGSISGRASMASVAVDLRLTSVESGLVQESISIYKRIVSQETDLGIFRFIRINWLLELEFGYTLNEPVQLAVREALEKAVINLIVKAVRSGLPGFKVAKKEDMKFFEEYKLDQTKVESEKMEQLLQKQETEKEGTGAIKDPRQIKNYRG